ncbi:MAG: ArsR/SmtB family transcription factor [Phycisphaerae bacterium]|nr:metalloregulator ArsR/SmtB family transcription factor [Tepidisphaeraceae bacterium]
MVKRPVRVSEQDLDQLTSLFRLLSDKTRLNILMMLAQGERNVTSLCQELDLPQPTVSHHLGLLRMNNLIGNRRDGKQVYYGINGRFETPSENSLSFAVENYAIQLVARHGETGDPSATE